VSSVLAAFTKPGLKSVLGTAASMPNFAQAPAAQLAADARTQIGARATENEREVVGLFKAAASAADAAVEGELRSAGDNLRGKAAMSTLQKSVEVACWRAFDEQLGVFTWAARVPNYAMTKMQVQKESVEARWGRFAASHEKRLGAFLHTGLQSASTSCKERLQAITLPMLTPELDSQFQQIVVFARDAMAEHAKGLVDSNAFREATRQLDAWMAEQKQHLQDKNVKFWKVYADGATRCAAERNAQRAVDSGSFGLFNNIPWVHRYVSHDHITRCFSEDSVSAKMTPQLQTAVFEVWYDTDLAKAAGRVRSCFYMSVVTLAFLIVGGWWWRRTNRMRAMYLQPGMAPGYYQTTGFWGQPRVGCYGQQQAAGAYQPYQQPTAARRGFDLYRGGA